MSFSAEVRNELIGKLPSAAHCRKAELCGYFVYKGRMLSDGSLEFVTENPAISKKVFTFLKKSFNMGFVAVTRKAEGQRRTEHVVRIPDADETAQLLKELRLGTSMEREDGLTILSEDILSQSCCKRSFLRAAFCMAGTMNDPTKSYHFEIAAPEESVGRILASEMESFGCIPKTTERRGNTCLYLKDGNSISDMLNVMEAHGLLLRYENERSMRDLRGHVNRKVNIEISNLRKVAKAAEKQIKDIEYLRDTVGLGSLPQELADMARLRIEHPESALSELGEMCKPPLGRSGVNHRLQKLCNMAEQRRRII